MYAQRHYWNLQLLVCDLNEEVQVEAEVVVRSRLR
jgi:hypothetical protein